MKRIGVLTRDCAGVNACLRAVVRTACFYNIEVVGIYRGYEGLIDADFLPLCRRSVSGIINQGGTILKTARSQRFLTEAGRKQAVKNIKEHKLDGIIVIGGNGSLSGAHVLASECNITTIGIPATIDNDVNGVELTIGADTAVNVALDALDKIRDTATSLERIFVVEVMGRDCGYIALQAAVAGGCEEVLIPEREFDIESMSRAIKEGNNKGKISWIIIVAEGRAKASDVARTITSETSFETRVVVLGHIQRGGSPTALDRILAARLGNYAVELINDGISGHCVALNKNKLVSVPLETVTYPKKSEIEIDSYYRLIKILT
ncbi:MAG: ATP-dependent 6-phosphofructokinase [Candidatus Omnitrophota bacterium]